MEFPHIERYPVIALDTETTGIEWNKDRIFGISISTPDNKDYYWDVREEPKVVEWLQDTLYMCNMVVNHNIKFDIHMLANEGILFNMNAVRCTMINASLIDENLSSYTLDYLSHKYLKDNKVSDIYKELADMFGGAATRSVQIQNLHRAPSALVAPYAKKDTRLALQLYEWQEKEIDRQNLRKVESLEYRLFPFVFRMERNGIRINEDLARTTKDRLIKKAEYLQKEISDMAGFPVNPNPSQSIVKLFNPKYNTETKQWVCEDGTVVPSTAGGKPSLGADQLLVMKHPAAKKILECRKLYKTANTFIQAHVVDRLHRGRVHPNINQTKGDSHGGMEGTATGRLSYTRPALQQIPSRDKVVAEIVRPIFIPEEGHGWSYGDLDQHEYRVFAHYANSPKLIEQYQDNPDLDIHQAVADLTGLPRSAKRTGQANAKQINLGMVFNMGGGALAEKMGLPFTIESFTDRDGTVHEYKKAGPEAEEVMDRYYEIVPGVKEVAKKASAIAKSRGYVITMGGRHIRFPGGLYTHKASGLIYQGTSADFNKENCCRICEYLDSECPEGRLLLNIHDEYSVSIPHHCDSAGLLKDLKAEIQRRPELRVPIRIDFSEVGTNWWDATCRESCTK